MNEYNRVRLSRTNKNEMVMRAENLNDRSKQDLVYSKCYAINEMIQKKKASGEIILILLSYYRY